MISQFNTYALGNTNIVVGLSATVKVDLSKIKACNGAYVKVHAGSATLAIVNGQSSVAGDGFVFGATQILEINGPATFFLAAAGATMTASVMIKYSQGYSTTPG